MKTYNIPEKVIRLHDAEDGKGLFFIITHLIKCNYDWEVQEERIYLKDLKCIIS